VGQRAADAGDIAHARIRQGFQRAFEDGQSRSDIRVMFHFA